MDALLLLASMVTSLGFEGTGDFLLDAEGHIARVPEAARLALRLSRRADRASAGSSTMRPSGAFSTNLLWDRAIEKSRLYGVRLDGVWMHVGTADAVKEAEDFLADLAPA